MQTIRYGKARLRRFFGRTVKSFRLEHGPLDRDNCYPIITVKKSGITKL